MNYYLKCLIYSRMLFKYWLNAIHYYYRWEYLIENVEACLVIYNIAKHFSAGNFTLSFCQVFVTHVEYLALLSNLMKYQVMEKCLFIAINGWVLRYVCIYLYFYIITSLNFIKLYQNFLSWGSLQPTTWTKIIIIISIVTKKHLSRTVKSSVKTKSNGRDH